MGYFNDITAEILGSPSQEREALTWQETARLSIVTLACQQGYTHPWAMEINRERDQEKVNQAVDNLITAPQTPEKAVAAAVEQIDSGIVPQELANQTTVNEGPAPDPNHSAAPELSEEERHLSELRARIEALNAE